MKRILLIPGLMMALLLASPVVNNAQAQTKKKTTTTTTTTQSSKASAANIAAGKELVSKSDCMACHKVDEKLVGPAYKDVAKKYPATEANYAKLAKKVIDGGGGVWGEIPMTPHAALSMADAKKMAQYILSLK